MYILLWTVWAACRYIADIISHSIRLLSTFPLLTKRRSLFEAFAGVGRWRPLIIAMFRSHDRRFSDLSSSVPQPSRRKNHRVHTGRWVYSVGSGLRYHFPVTYWRDVWPSYWWAYDLVTCPRAVLACLPRRLWTRWSIRVIVSHVTRELRRVARVQLLVNNG